MIWGLIVLIAIFAIPVAIEVWRPQMDADARRGAEGHFAQLSQGVTCYDWLGPVRGPVAVCVHGLTTPSFVWRGLARGLALMGYRVLIYDLYGRGFSDRPEGAQTRAFFLRQLEDLLEDQEVGGDITLMGYSMGGAIATCFAAAHPDRIRQLVLIAPAGMGVKAGWLTRVIAGVPVLGDWLMLAGFSGSHKRATERERDLPTSVEGIVDLQQRELQFKGYIPAVLSSLRGILSKSLEAEHKALAKRGVPVLAVWGRMDDVIAERAPGQLAEWNRHARQEVVETAGHGLVYTHTEFVLAALRETLRDGLS